MDKIRRHAHHAGMYADQPGGNNIALPGRKESILRRNRVQRHAAPLHPLAVTVQSADRPAGYRSAIKHQDGSPRLETPAPMRLILRSKIQTPSTCGSRETGTGT